MKKPEVMTSQDFQIPFCIANKLTHFSVVTVYMPVLWSTAAFIVPEPNDVTITSF